MNGWINIFFALFLSGLPPESHSRVEWNMLDIFQFFFFLKRHDGNPLTMVFYDDDSQRHLNIIRKANEIIKKYSGLRTITSY